MLDDRQTLEGPRQYHGSHKNHENEPEPKPHASCTPAFDDTAKGEGKNAKLWAMGLFSTVDTPLAHKELLCEMMIRNAANH
jgi:hypothetical protein